MRKKCDCVLYKRFDFDMPPLKDKFFSASNLRRLQTEIQRGVFEHTGQRVAPQKDVTMKVIMRSVYEEYRFQTCHVETLNRIVVDELVRDVSSKVQMYRTFLRDRDGPSTILPRPDYGHTRGEDQLEHGSFFGRT